MQPLAVISLFFLLYVFFMKQGNKALIAAFSLIQQAKKAKFKGFEFELSDRNKQIILECIRSDNKWAKVIISDLNATHIALLLSIDKEGSLKCSEQIKNNLRNLRDKGLLKYNRDTIKESDTVWLSELGNEIVDIIKNITSSAITKHL